MASKSFRVGIKMNISSVLFSWERQTTRLKDGHVIGRVEADHVFGQQRQGNVRLGIAEPSVPGAVVVASTDDSTTVKELGRRRGLR